MSRKRKIIIGITVILLLFLGWTFVLDVHKDAPLGATVTTINATDLISDSRAVINTNFSNLNADKLETTTFYATTTHSQISSLSSLSVVGTITTGTWNATAISATKGGTGFTTYSTGDLIYASAANTLSKRAASTTGEILTLKDGVPTWSSQLTISANQQSPFTANGLSYIFPPAYNASGTNMMQNGAGKMSWGYPDWQLLEATTTANTMATTTFRNLPSRRHYKLVLSIPQANSMDFAINLNGDNTTAYEFTKSDNATSEAADGPDPTSVASTSRFALNDTIQTHQTYIEADFIVVQNTVFVKWSLLGPDTSVNFDMTEVAGSGIYMQGTSGLTQIDLGKNSQGTMNAGVTAYLYASGS